MNWNKIFISAFSVSLYNLVSGILGYACYNLFGGENQLAVQVPVSLLSGILLIVVWVVYFQKINGLQSDRDFLAVLLLAFPVAAVLFTGVHYFVTGYLTSWGNIVSLVMVQFVENTFGLFVGYIITQQRLKNTSLDQE